MSEFKHRKGFREDAQILAEAYENIYDNREQLDEVAPLVAGLARGAIAGIAGKQIGKKMSDAVVVGDIGEDEHDASSDEELSDDWMKQDYESRQEGSAVEDAMDALQQIGIEIQEDIPGEDGSLEQQRNLAPLAKAHNLLSVALIKLVGEHGRNWVMGGQADAVDAAGSEPEQFTPMEFPSDEEY